MEQWGGGVYRLALLFLLLLPSSAWAQGQAISQLPPATQPFTGTELVPLVQNGSTVNATLGDLAIFFGGVPPTPPAFTAITLSGNTFVGGSPSGTTIGTVTASLSTGVFAGTIAVNDTAHFQITGTPPNFLLQTSAVVPPGTYSIILTATQSGVSNSPYTGASPYTVTGTGGGSCTTSLNFSQACNSAYVALVF